MLRKKLTNILKLYDYICCLIKVTKKNQPVQENVHAFK